MGCENIVFVEMEERMEKPYLPMIEYMVKIGFMVEGLLAIKVSAAIVFSQLLIVFMPGDIEYEVGLRQSFPALVGKDEINKDEIVNKLWREKSFAGGAAITNCISNPKVDNYSFTLKQGLPPEVLEIVLAELKLRVTKYQKESL